MSRLTRALLVLASCLPSFIAIPGYGALAQDGLYSAADRLDLAFRDPIGHQRMRLALKNTASLPSPVQGSHEATELGRYGRLWSYLRSLQDIDPRSTSYGPTQRAYVCFVTARRNAMSVEHVQGDDVAGQWLTLAEACAAKLNERVVDWAITNAVPLRAKDLRGTTPYLFFFRFDDAAVTAFSQRLAVHVGAFEGQRGRLAGRIAGHADRAGPESYNHRLSLRRARSLEGELAALGDPPRPASIEAHGERTMLVTTKDGEPHPRNRRVVVQFDVGE